MTTKETSLISLMPGMVVLTETSSYRVVGQNGSMAEIKRLAPNPRLFETPVETFAAKGILDGKPIVDVLPAPTQRARLMR